MKAILNLLASLKIVLVEIKQKVSNFKTVITQDSGTLPVNFPQNRF